MPYPQSSRKTHLFRSKIDSMQNLLDPEPVHLSPSHTTTKTETLNSNKSAYFFKTNSQNNGV